MFSITVYYLSGQIMEVPRLAQVLIVMNIVGLVFQDYGMVLGMLMHVTVSKLILAIKIIYRCTKLLEHQNINFDYKNCEFSITK